MFAILYFHFDIIQSDIFNFDICLASACGWCDCAEMEVGKVPASDDAPLLPPPLLLLLPLLIYLLLLLLILPQPLLLPLLLLLLLALLLLLLEGASF